MSRRTEWILSALCVGAFLVMAGVFASSPIFEGPDEMAHYRTARYLAYERALPHPAGDERGEYHQPPLYYALTAPFIALMDDRADYEAIAGRLNPYFGYAFEVPHADNKNVYVHSRSETLPAPDSPTARAVYLMRGVSVLFGLMTVALGRWAFGLLWPARDDAPRRVLALATLTLWGQFVYLTSVITNDAPIIALSTATLVALLWMQRHGDSWAWAVALGLILGLALLTKSSALVLGFAVGLTVLTTPRLWRYVPLVLVVSFGMSGWWYARNVQLVGDPTGINAIRETWAGEFVTADGSPNWSIGFARAPYAYETLWARFGNGVIAVHPLAYAAFDALVTLAAVGLLGLLIGHIRRRGGWLDSPDARTRVTLLAYTLIWVPMLVYYSARIYSGNQGRFLLSVVVGWSALMAWGLTAWLPRRWHGRVALVGMGVQAALMAWAVVGYVIPAYQVDGAAPDMLDRTAYTFDCATLHGAQVSTATTTPNGELVVTLHWTAHCPTERDLLVYIHTLDGFTVRRDSYPAGGALLSSEWHDGDTFSGRYVVRVADDATPQRVYPLVAGLYDPIADAPLTAYTVDGSPALPVIGELIVQGDPAPLSTAHTFGDGLRLAPPTLTADADGSGLCLAWTTDAPLTDDWRVFVHFLDADGALIGQADGVPLGGAYPFSAWRAGEVVRECVERDVMAASARVGVYHAATGERLPVVGGGDSVTVNLSED